MKNEIRIYLLATDCDIQPLLEKVCSNYTLNATGTEQTTLSCLDTFDWRLHEAGQIITRKRGRYHLEDGVGNGLLSATGSRKNHPFSWDLQESELRERVGPALDVRAMLPHFLVEREVTSFALLNKDEKTVLRLMLVKTGVMRTSDDGGERELPYFLHVLQLRGYNKPFRSVCGQLDEEGVETAGSGYSYVTEIHRMFGVDPKQTSSKFVVSLASDENVSQAVRDICLQLKGAMVLNLDGVREDIDSEFLHDLRVAVRRTRSLLSLMKDYLPKESVDYFKAEFKWVGSFTGPTRDLDVYLLKGEEFKSMLPELLHPGLDQFFQGLEQQRRKSIRQLRRELASERFARLLETWEAFLLQLPELDDFPPGKKSCRKVSEKIIRKRFAKILRDGAQITQDSPDQHLHKLRIEAKKFRYILEFFRSLFDTDGVEKYLKQLKKLQNNLGDFNDLCVQADMLAYHMESMASSDTAGVRTGAALGGLIVHMTDEQKNERRKFEKTFSQFASAENIELLETIFTTGPTQGKGGKP